MSLVRLAGIVKESIVDGPGFRFAIFAQGCPHHCPGCHNPHTHDASQGQNFDIDALIQMIKANPLLDGITLSGGEPFMQAEALSELAMKVRDQGLHVMTYTGYTYEQILAGIPLKRGWEELLRVTDILVDGPFIESRKDLSLRFRGSGNQRVIDVQKSLLENKVVLYPL